MLECVKDTDEAIVDRNHETRGEQLQLEARVHERRAVREELEVRDDAEEPARGLRDLRLVGPVVPFRLSEIPRDAGEQFLRALDDLPFVVFLQVTLSKDAQGVLGQLRIRLTGHDVEGP